MNPQPTGRLAADALPLSRMQRLVLKTLHSFEDGAKASEIAQKLDMHINTVRAHLDELCDMRAVVTERKQSGRRGRPSVVFHARVPASNVLLDEHAELINTLAELLGDPNDENALQRAEEIGVQWARRLNRSGVPWSSVAEASESLVRVLRRLGFDPHTHTIADDATNITVHACPFSSERQPPSQLVCSIHRGFLTEVLGPCSDGTAEVELHPQAQPSACEIVIRKANPSA